ncbi:hypothetical protein PYCC9005_001544 [Savitreella phatthalungensis]
MKVVSVVMEDAVGFYTARNLPGGGGQDGRGTDWRRRMVYRVVLRSPLPPCKVHAQRSGAYTAKVAIQFGIVNEMSLYPQGAVGETEKIRCNVRAIDAVTGGNSLEDVCVEVLPGVPKGEGVGAYEWAGLRGGKGCCEVRLHMDSMPAQGRQIWLEVAIENPVDRPLYAMPLVFGPIGLHADEKAAELTGDEILLFYRPLQTGVFGEAPLLVQEQPELAIPGKIWDSALFASGAALDLIRQDREKSQWTILDLSSGTGVCGLWLAVVLSVLGRDERGVWRPSCLVILSDLEESLTVMHRNREAVRNRLDSTRVSVDVRRIRWGEMSDLKMRKTAEDVEDDGGPEDISAEGVGRPDLVIACDLVYEPEYLLPLAHTFIDLCCAKDGGCVLIGYKQRGLSAVEKDALWRLFGRCFTSVEPVIGDNIRATALDPERGPTAQHCGIELWLLSRPKSRDDALAALSEAVAAGHAETGLD